MRLNKATSHAIRILIDCARSGDGLIKVADLSSRLDITTQNVFKIVNILSRAQLIAATRGRYGGVRLARPAHEIKIGDVVRAMETTEIEIESDRPDLASEFTAATGVNRVLDSALEAFISVLDQHSVADMARAPKVEPSDQKTIRRVKRQTSVRKAPSGLSQVRRSARVNP